MLDYNFMPLLSNYHPSTQKNRFTTSTGTVAVAIILYWRIAFFATCTLCLNTLVHLKSIKNIIKFCYRFAFQFDQRLALTSYSKNR